MKTAENYQQQAVGNKEQTVITDQALTAETDELNLAFEAEQLHGPEDEDDEDEPGLDQGEDDDPDLISVEEEDSYREP